MLVGHQRIWNFLTKSAGQNKLAHAYLFAGVAQVGKLTAALEFTKWLFCQNRQAQNIACGQCPVCRSVDAGQNPDVFILLAKQTVKNEVVKKAEIGISEIRDLQHKLSLFPYSAPYKVAIIEEVAGLSDEAASALLKTLEEPSSHSLIIMISSSWQGVLPTIISRCQLIKFLPVAEKEIEAKLKSLAKKEDEVERIIKLAAGRPGRAIKLLQEPELLLEQKKEAETFEKLLKSPLAWRMEEAFKMSQNTALAQETLDQWLLWLRDRILEISGQAGLTITSRVDSNFLSRYRLADLLGASREIQKTRSLLVNASFNARLALEVLMIKL